MSKILFLEKKLRNEKLGLMYLSSTLKNAGHDTRLTQTDVEDTKQVLEDYNPDYIAFSISTGEHNYALETSRNIKGLYPHIKSIFGGPHPTFFPEIAHESGVDYVVRGPGERTIVDIVNGKISDTVTKSSLIRDINKLPHPDREVIYSFDEFKNNPMKNVITQRDCPYSCAYCYNHSWRELFKDEKSKMFQRKSVSKTIEEIKQIKDNYPLEKVLFIDDSFIIKNNDKWIEKFCENYEREVGLPFLCSIRANFIDEPTVRMMKNAGLEMVNFALETVDPEVRRKVLNRKNISNKDIVNAINLFKKYDVRSRMQNMIGLPIKDPLGEAINTLKFNLENNVTDSWASIFQPYPRTALAKYCLDNGFIDNISLENCANSFYDESRINIPDKEKLGRLQKWWYFIVDNSLPLELVDIMLEIPLTEKNQEDLKNLRFEFNRKKLYGLD
jgi:anaerobic magnesium-protoporphyrin IX monomethyl ester cyclase